MHDAMKSDMEIFLGDFRQIWQCCSMRWLNMSVLLYVAILPFNAFGFMLPGTSYVLKYTEVALLLIVFFGVLAWRRGAMQLVRAPWLYTFLALHVAAQFLSLINAVNIALGLRIALAVSSYAVLMVIMVNAVHSEELLRTALIAMGIGATIVVLHSVLVFFMQGGVFQTRLETQPSIIGNEIPHYFAYLLIMFGAGILYVAYSVQQPHIRYGAWILIFLWAFIIFASASKLAQVGVFLALIVLAVTCLREFRAVAFTACLVVLALIMQWKIVPLKNAMLVMAHGAQQRVAVIQYERSSRIASPERFELDLTTPTIWTKVAAVVADASDQWQRQVAPSSEAGGTEVGVAQRTIPQPGALVPGITKPTSHSRSIPPVVAAPKLLDEYAAENNFVQRWRAPGPMDVRFRGWMTAFLFWLEHPFVGVGVAQVSSQRVDDTSRLIAAHATDFTFLPYLPFRSRLLSGHVFQDGVVGIYNIYLSALAETGLLGLFAFIGILVIVIARSVAALIRQFSLRRRCSLQFFLPVLLALLGSIHMGEYLWLHPWLWTLLAFTYVSARVSQP